MHLPFPILWWGGCKFVESKKCDNHVMDNILIISFQEEICAGQCLSCSRLVGFEHACHTIHKIDADAGMRTFVCADTGHVHVQTAIFCDCILTIALMAFPILILAQESKERKIGSSIFQEGSWWRRSKKCKESSCPAWEVCRCHS